jgi:uncharacterized protein DUF2505
MSTRLKHDMTYDAPLADVRAMLDDPIYREQVLEAQHNRRSSVVVEVVDGNTTVVLDQVQRTDRIPSFARKFVGSELNIVQREVWMSTAYAELHVEIPGRPGQMVGSITLAEDAGRTTETVDVEINVHVPLVGGKIEKLISDFLRKALGVEERVARAYLIQT